MENNFQKWNARLGANLGHCSSSNSLNLVSFNISHLPYLSLLALPLPSPFRVFFLVFFTGAISQHYTVNATVKYPQVSARAKHPSHRFSFAQIPIDVSGTL